MALSDRALIRTQAISGLLFASFLVVHLANTFVAPAGQDTYDSFQQTARNVYQLPPVEIIAVLGAAFVHVVAGVVRIVRRRRARKSSGAPAPTETLRQRMHRYTGYFLVMVFGGHVFATRGVGVFFDMPADFSYLTFSLETWPAMFYVYYFLLGTSGLFHMTNGTIIALGALGKRLPAGLSAPRSRPFWLVIGVGAVLIVVAISALGGHMFDVDRSRNGEFKAWYEEYAPELFLPWK